MTFTDEELKRLKDSLEHAGNPEDLDVSTGEKWIALIARLEAAELCLELPHMKHTESTEDMKCTFCSRYKAWRKTKGEDSSRRKRPY